jgi:choline-glycine betaine transporter
MTGYGEFHISSHTAGHRGDLIDTVGIIGTVDGITTTVGTTTMDRVGEEVMLLIYTVEEGIHQELQHQAVL